ncbi:hypothetical protein VNO78_23561 [Psophocarpus tetragonolobus]|uniref:Uncharacterized protein n=1 Tax=Psophocarpus tetragonolobus TaxID=3891 RepID=A0AAN9S6W0_PSOTE
MNVQLGWSQEGFVVNEHRGNTLFHIAENPYLVMGSTPLDSGGILSWMNVFQGEWLTSLAKVVSETSSTSSHDLIMHFCGALPLNLSQMEQQSHYLHAYEHTIQVTKMLLDNTKEEDALDKLDLVDINVDFVNTLVKGMDSQA